MEQERAESARASLRERLAAAIEKQSLDSKGQVSWLLQQFENYLERWLTFCEMPSIPMESLLQDDLCAMVRIGAEELSSAVERLGEEDDGRTAWQSFHQALSGVLITANRNDALLLRGYLSRVKETVN